jgi:hypothetical protein
MPTATVAQYARSARRSDVIRRKGTGSIVEFVARVSQSGFDRPVTGWLRWWVIGAVAGTALLWSMMFSPFAAPFVVALLVALVVRSPERAAVGGGALVPTGVWFAYQLRAAVERCAEIDRGPSGSCSIEGVPEQAIAMGLWLAIGIGLTAYAAGRARWSSSRPPA